MQDQYCPGQNVQAHGNEYGRKYSHRTKKDIDHDIFIANAKNEYGYKGAKEATDILSRASALFAGGELEDSAKDLFFQSLMEVYLESKEEARAKFTPKRSRKKRSKE